MGESIKKLVLATIIGSMFLNGCGSKEESDNISDQKAQIQTEYISDEEIEKNHTESIIVEETEEIKQDSEIHKKAQACYYEKLTEFFKNGTWPEDSESVWQENEWLQYEYWENYEYAIADIDLDGADELLLACTGGDIPMAGMVERVYGYDPDRNDVSIEIEEFPRIRFYDNGYAQANLSHNQGLGESLWPYTIYKYDEKDDDYDRNIMVDSWEKSYMPEDFNGNPFPDELDPDGDGVIYYINDYSKILNKKEYEKLYDSYFKNATEIKVEYYDINEENINKILQQ